MRWPAYILSAALLTGCASDEKEELSDEACSLVDPDECESSGCGTAIEIREVMAEEPSGDDDCFGEPAEICVRQPEQFENNAFCIYAWRGDRVLRMNSAEVPRGWNVCHGGEDEPPQCACYDVGGCSR